MNSEELRRLIASKGLTISMVQRLTGIRNTTISNQLKGKKIIKPELANKYRLILGQLPDTES